MPLAIKRTSLVTAAANSVQFNGSNQYLSVTNTGLFGSGNWTFECWINAPVGQTDKPIIETRNSAGGAGSSTGFTVTMITPTEIRLWCGSQRIRATANYVNQWLHIAVVKNNTTTTMYFNGVSVGTTTLGDMSDTSFIVGAGYYGEAYINAYGNFYTSNMRVVKGSAVYTAAFTPPTSPLTAIANTALLTCNVPTIVDGSSNNFTITNNGTATVSSITPFTPALKGLTFKNRFNNTIAFSGTQRAIFGYGSSNVTNLVSNTGVVANDTSGVGTSRTGLAAASYGSDKAIFGYGNASSGVTAITNLVSNTGVVSSDTTGVGTARGPAAASYGIDKAIFGYGTANGSLGLSITNLVSNTGVVATDTTGVGTGRWALAAAGYGSDKAIFGYGWNNNVGYYTSITNKVSNLGVVANDTTGVGSVRSSIAAAGYGTDKAIFGYGYGNGNLSITNKVNNVGDVATDTTGVGTGRINLAAAGYGTDKAIFGYGMLENGGSFSITNLVSNTGVVSTDTTGVGTARNGLAAAGYLNFIPAPSGMQMRKVNADPATIVTNGLVLNLDASNVSSYPGSGTSWFDLSGNGNNGTLYNGPAFSNSSSSVISFDGGDDYFQANVNTAALDGDPSLSVDMFVRRRTGTNIGGGGENAGGSFWGIGGSGQGNSINGWTPTTNLIHLDIYDSTRLATSVYYPENQFVHICWTKNGAGTETTNVKCYVNGVEVALTKNRSATRTNQFNTSTSGKGICLGRANADSSIFPAPIDIGTFKVYSRALSSNEVLQNYNANRAKFGL